MEPQVAIDLSREAIKTCIYVGGPVLVVVLLLGITISVVQAMTQLHDQAISIVPKILVTLLVVALFLPLLSRPLMDFAADSFGKPMWMNGAHVSSDENQPEPVSMRVARKTTPARTISGPAFSAMPSGDRQLQGSQQPNDDQSIAPRMESPFILPHYQVPKQEDDKVVDLEG